MFRTTSGGDLSVDSYDEDNDNSEHNESDDDNSKDDDDGGKDDDDNDYDQNWFYIWEFPEKYIKMVAITIYFL